MVIRARRRKKSRLHKAVARYRDASKSLHTPASRQSRYGLDWMNFFIADVQTGFGTFVAFYLAHLGWSEGRVGVVLTAGSLAGVVSQIPGGALADAVTWKRGLIDASKSKHGRHAHVFALAKSHKLILFTGALVPFQLADASMLPLIGENLATTTTEQSPLWMSGLIIVPQIVVALFAPWVGYHSEKKGRRPLLLIGFALEPARAALLAFTANYALLIVAQLLNGITGAIIGVLTILVITDLTAGTGRFNLAQGAVGAAIGVAASLSTLATGFFFQGFGKVAGFIVIAAIASAATILLWLYLAETKPPITRIEPIWRRRHAHQR